MQYTTNFSTDIIDEETLMSVVDTLKGVTGQDITVGATFAVSTEDINMSALLDALREMLIAEVGGSLVEKSRKTAKVKKAKKEKPAAAILGPRSLKDVDTGRIISKVQLARDLAGSAVFNGEVYEDHTGQRWVIVDGKLVKEPQS